jgi:hypothetical protein
MWIIAIAVILLVLVGPVMVGARVVGAGHQGFWRCFGALFVAGFIGAIAVRMFGNLGFLSVFGSAIGFSWVLDTTYLRGLAIALIQTLLAVVLVVVLMATALGGVFKGAFGEPHGRPAHTSGSV